MNRLQASIASLENRAQQERNLQCNSLCFMENCDRCRTGLLYQAGVLRSNAALLQSKVQLPTVPKSLYQDTIRRLEQQKVL